MFFCIEQAHQLILENPMAEEYGTFKELNRKTLKLIIKKNSSRRKEKQLSNPCRLQSTQMWQQRNDAYSNNKTPVQSIRAQISFGSLLQTFPWKCNTRELQPITSNTDGKTVFHSVMQLYSLKQWTKRKVFTTSFIFVWTFENQVQVLYASPEVQVFSRFRWPETHIRHQNGRQRAKAVLDSNNNFQKTTTVVNGV